MSEAGLRLSRVIPTAAETSILEGQCVELEASHSHRTTSAALAGAAA